MKLKEVIVENQINEVGPMDSFRAGIYNNLGIGGGAGNAAAHKKYFTDNFKKQLQLNTSKTTSKPEAVERIANSFMKKYGVSDSAVQNPEFQELVQKAGSEKGFFSPALNQLIDKMYLLASTTVQQDQPRQGFNTPTQGPAGGSRTPQQTTQPEQLSGTTQQVIQSIQKLTGKENFDDLSRIAKTAMRMLYKQNPQQYTQLYNQITGKSTSTPTTSAPTSNAGANAFNNMTSNLTAPATTSNAGANAFNNMSSNLTTPRTPKPSTGSDVFNKMANNLSSRTPDKEPYRPLSRREPTMESKNTIRRKK
jgi:hypothetical protein